MSSEGVLTVSKELDLPIAKVTVAPTGTGAENRWRQGRTVKAAVPRPPRNRDAVK